MSISIKNSEQINKMRVAGKLASSVLEMVFMVTHLKCLLLVSLALRQQKFAK